LTATRSVGALGNNAGMTAVDAADRADVPPTEIALTVNVYDVPLVREETVQPRIGLPETGTGYEHDLVGV
jgi:hypothetical protein